MHSPMVSSGLSSARSRESDRKVIVVCYDCRNTESFRQVSPRGDARDLRQGMGDFHPSPWQGTDSREPGIYCATCAQPVDADLEAAGLLDARVAFVLPEEFDPGAFGDELRELRPDAEWSTLVLPACDARYSEAPESIHSDVLEALRRTGRTPLFSHQAASISAALDGRNVIQSTSAGSGKSIGFLAPVLDRLVRDPKATALLMFPMRALVNDQLQAIERLSSGEVEWHSTTSFDLRLTEGSPLIRVARYDGGTQEHERAGIRGQARLIVATPDMVHASILRKGLTNYKDGTSWLRFISGLEVIVLDEVHSYSGVFGSNVSHVIRRLRRLAARCGQRPQFLAASATVGNPVEHVERLTGVSPFELVDDDGSRRSERLVLICNPPSRQHDGAPDEAPPSGQAAPSTSEVGRIAPQTIAIDLITSGALTSPGHDPIRTIAFCQSRSAVFQMTQRVKNALKEKRRGDVAGSVAAYAATFLDDDRAAAEGRLRDGSTLAIVSTNALELGIDIPDLSFAVLVGYPGQISSFRQRIGRVGRTGPGVAALIVGDDPLQQHLARDPETLQQLLTLPAETVIINPEAPEVARRYGLEPACAEFGGVSFEDAEFFGERLIGEWLSGAAGSPDCTIAGADYWNVGAEAEPYFPLRSAVGGESYTVIAQRGRDRNPIGKIDQVSAIRDAFVPAIWVGSDGSLYQVTGRDASLHEIYCEGPIDVGFTTRGVPVDRVSILEQARPAFTVGGATVGYGNLSINRQVFSYREQHFSGFEATRPVEVGWPSLDFTTDGLIINVGGIWSSDDERLAAVRAFEHVLLAAVPAIVACDPYDLDTSSDRDRVYLYDSFGGGIRISEAAFDRFAEVVELSHAIVTGCSCSDGCPSCIMLGRKPNDGLSKAGAISILAAMIEVSDG